MKNRFVGDRAEDYFELTKIWLKEGYMTPGLIADTFLLAELTDAEPDFVRQRRESLIKQVSDSFYDR